MITVIDYGVGNLASILNLCRHLDIEARLCSRPEELSSSERILLPGVGAFDPAMSRLDSLGFSAAIRNAVRERGAALLGICLGMQLLTESSEEGSCAGLGLIRGHTRRITTPAGSTARLLIPHMGWNVVTPSPSSRLFEGLPEAPRFYFVHSFHVVCDDEVDAAAKVHYGAQLTAAVERGRIMGTQFHPEKSHRFGMQVIRNFSKL